MADTRGVFRLRDLYDLKIEDEWVDLGDVWISPSPFFGPPPNTGYFGGGTPGPRSTMDKLTYSSDTTAAVPGAFLTFQQGDSETGRFGLSATGNSDAGYFGGGSGSSPTTVVEKLVYSSDTTSRIPGADLTIGRYGVAATGDSSFGYFSGGIGISSIDKTNYSTDTTTLIPGSNLSINRNNHAASSARANALPSGLSAPVIV